MTDVLTADQVSEVRAFVRTALRGYTARDEVVEAAVDYFTGTYPDSSVEVAARKALAVETSTLIGDVASWPPVTDNDRLATAFTSLEQRGVVARENFACCQSCGSYEIGEELDEASKKHSGIKGYVFFHAQDTDRAVEGGGLYLSFGSVAGTEASAIAVASEAIAALNEAGLSTTWEGTAGRRIFVSMNWLRRPDWLDA